jgi:hypothetical protein
LFQIFAFQEERPNWILSYMFRPPRLPDLGVIVDLQPRSGVKNGP